MPILFPRTFFHFSLFIYNGDNFNSWTKIPTSSFLDQHTSQFLDKSIDMPKYLVFGQTFINWTTVPRWKLALPRENSHLSTCSGLDLKNGMHTFWVTALVGWQCATCTLKVFLILPFDFDVLDICEFHYSLQTLSCNENRVFPVKFFCNEKRGSL